MKFLGYFAIEGAGSTVPGDPYLSCCTENDSNVSIHTVFRPH